MEIIGEGGSGTDLDLQADEDDLPNRSSHERILEPITSASAKAPARQPRKLPGLEARGVEPLSSSLSAQTSTRLSGEKF